MTSDTQQTTDDLVELEGRFVDRYGPLMGSAALAEALGFASVGAFRQACWRRKIDIPMFNVPGRAGRFAITYDVVRWLWALRDSERGAESRS